MIVCNYFDCMLSGLYIRNNNTERCIGIVVKAYLFTIKIYCARMAYALEQKTQVAVLIKVYGFPVCTIA